MSLQNGKLLFQSLQDDKPAAFIKTNSDFLVKYEKVFLLLVLIDALITATKHAEMDKDIQEPMQRALQAWQVKQIEHNLNAMILNSITCTIHVCAELD